MSKHCRDHRSMSRGLLIKYRWYSACMLLHFRDRIPPFTLMRQNYQNYSFDHIRSLEQSKGDILIKVISNIFKIFLGLSENCKALNSVKCILVSIVNFIHLLCSMWWIGLLGKNSRSFTHFFVKLYTQRQLYFGVNMWTVPWFSLFLAFQTVARREKTPFRSQWETVQTMQPSIAADTVEKKPFHCCCVAAP